MDITATAAVAVLVGAAAPVITAIIKQPHWSSDRKRLLSLVVAAVLGLLSAIVTGAIEPPADAGWSWWRVMVGWLVWVVSITAVVISISQGIYQQLKPQLDGLTDATSPVLDPEPAGAAPKRAEPDSGPAEPGDGAQPLAEL